MRQCQWKTLRKAATNSLMAIENNNIKRYTENEDDDFVLMNEDDGGAAQCAGSVGAAAPEHLEACVVQGLPAKAKRRPSEEQQECAVTECTDMIEERLAKRKAKNAELKEAIRNDGIRDYLQKNEGPKDYPDKPALRKRPEVKRVNYKGSEEYEKQRKEWLKGKNRPKAFENYYDGLPSRNTTVGDIELDKRFEDGQVDDFLAWYEYTFESKKK